MAYLKRFASSINGRFSDSDNSFHSAPNRFDISELCIFGLSWAILRRCPLDQTMKAFMGRLIWSPLWLLAALLCWWAVWLTVVGIVSSTSVATETVRGVVSDKYGAVLFQVLSIMLQMKYQCWHTIYNLKSNKNRMECNYLAELRPILLRIKGRLFQKFWLGLISKSKSFFPNFMVQKFITIDIRNWAAKSTRMIQKKR